MKKMKMNNKGFSLVELIIVIAIMAILAGALAPALISYVAKSRRSSDVSNAQTVASAIQAAVSDESGMDALENTANTHYATVTKQPLQLSTLSGKTDDFATIVNGNLQGGISAFSKLKSTKTSKKASTTTLQNVSINQTNGFYISVDPATSTIKVYIKTSGTVSGNSTGADGTGLSDKSFVELYPTTNDCMTK